MAHYTHTWHTERLYAFTDHVNTSYSSRHPSAAHLWTKVVCAICAVRKGGREMMTESSQNNCAGSLIR